MDPVPLGFFLFFFFTLVATDSDTAMEFRKLLVENKVESVPLSVEVKQQVGQVKYCTRWVRSGQVLYQVG